MLNPFAVYLMKVYTQDAIPRRCSTRPGWTAPARSRIFVRVALPLLRPAS